MYTKTTSGSLRWLHDKNRAVPTHTSKQLCNLTPCYARSTVFCAISYYTKSGLGFSAKATHLYSTIISPCFRLSASAQLKLLRLQFLFVFRRLQSLQLLLPTHPCRPLSFPTSLGRPFHGLSPLPFRFLTPAVSAFFRPLQFWVLTTQPLLFLSFSSRVCLAAASPVPASALASAVFPFSPA